MKNTVIPLILCGDSKRGRLRYLRGIPCKHNVSNGACRPNAMCVKTEAYPALGVVWQVLCVVKPPGAVIVPEVVVRIATDADGDF